MPRQWIAALYLCIAVAWIVVRADVFSVASMIEYSDSPSFLAKAAEPVWTADFFVGSGRFFVVPLFYKIVLAVSGSSRTHLTDAQFLLSLCAWIALGLSLASRFFSNWVGVLSFAAVLGFGLTTDVIEWDRTILSESVSTSLFVVFIALWIRLADDVTSARLSWLIVTAAAWSMSREANSMLLLPLAVVVALWAAWYGRGHRRTQIQTAILSAALVAIFAATFAISNNGDRWVFPLLNVIGKRVLPSPERTAFYASRLMPISPALMDMSGEFGSGKNWAFYNAPELADFRAWLLKRGKRVFAQDVVFHPIRSTVEPFADVNEFVCPILSWYWSPGFTPLYPYIYKGYFCGPFAAGSIVVGSLALGLVVITAAFLFRHRLDPPSGFRVLTVGGLLTGWLPFTWFTWHVIGQMEIGRHVWSGVLAFRMGAFLLTLFVLQEAATRRFARPSSS